MQYTCSAFHTLYRMSPGASSSRCKAPTPATSALLDGRPKTSNTQRTALLAVVATPVHTTHSHVLHSPCTLYRMSPGASSSRRKAPTRHFSTLCAHHVSTIVYTYKAPHSFPPPPLCRMSPGASSSRRKAPTCHFSTSGWASKDQQHPEGRTSGNGSSGPASSLSTPLPALYSKSSTPLPSMALPGHAGHSKSSEGGLLVGRQSSGEHRGSSAGQLTDALVSWCSGSCCEEGKRKGRKDAK